MKSKMILIPLGGCCIYILIFLLGIVIASFGSETVTKTGFVQSIDQQLGQIVVDNHIYTISTHMEVILAGHRTDIRKLRKGDFVLLTVKKGTSEILEIIAHPGGLEE